MTEGSEQFSLLLEDASSVPGAADDAARALVETFGLPFPVAQKILGSLPALVLKDQSSEVVEDVARRLRERGFLVRVRGPVGPPLDAAGGARSTTGDVPLVGIRRRTTTGAHAVPRDSGSVSAVGTRRTGAQTAVRERATGQRLAVAESGGFNAVREASTVRSSAAPAPNSETPSFDAPQTSAADFTLSARHAPAPPVSEPLTEHPLAGPAPQTPLPFDEPRQTRAADDDDFALDRLVEGLPSLDGPPSVPVPRMEPPSPVAPLGTEGSTADPAAPATDVAVGLPVPDARSRMLDELAALDESGISHFAMRPSFSMDGEVGGPAMPPAVGAPPPPVVEPKVSGRADDSSGAFRRVDVSERRVPPVRQPHAPEAPPAQGDFDRAEPSIRRQGSGGFDRAEPSIRRQGSGGFDRAEPSIRRQGSGGFDRAEPSVRVAPGEMAGERPKIQFEAAVMATTSSLDEDLQAVTDLYGDDAQKGAPGGRGPNAPAPVGTRVTGAHSAVGGRPSGSYAAVVGPPGSERRSGSATVWKIALALVFLILLGVGAQQIAARAGRTSVFERAARLHVTTSVEAGRNIERACADVGEGRFLCRYNIDHYLRTFPALERSVAELAVRECTSDASDDGQRMTETMVCRLRWTVADEEREYMLSRRVVRACDRSLLAMEAGQATTCDFAVETEFRRGTSLPQESRAADRRVLRMEGSRETLDTPAGYIDAIEFVSTPVEGGAGGTRMVHYAPSVRDFVREAAFGSAPHLQLTYRREPGREDGRWAVAD